MSKFLKGGFNPPFFCAVIFNKSYIKTLYLSIMSLNSIVDQLKNSNKTWEELNLELAKEHFSSLNTLETDLNYLSEEAKISLEKFKQLENHQEDEFEVYLDKFVNDI